MLFIILIFIGLYKNKKMLIYIAISLLYILSTSIFSNNFFKLLEGDGNRVLINKIDSANVIVVLSGMLKINEEEDFTYIEWSDPDRFFGGITLFKKGKASKIIFTGGKLPWDKTKKTEGEILKEYAIANGIQPDKILVTKDVENTEDEAKALKELNILDKKIILVTSAFHMYRAKRQFEKEGFFVIPYSVDFKTKNNEKINILDFLPSANNLALVETGVKEIMGRIFYIIKK